MSYLNEFLQDIEEVETDDEVFSLPNDRTLKINLGEMTYCRAGSMIAYNGDIKFESTSGGVGKWIKKHLTGESVPLMRASGRGELYLANQAAEITIISLNGETLFVEGRHLLAFESSIAWDLSMLKGMGGISASGLFTYRLSGVGHVALTSHGKPVALRTPIFVDPDALLAYSAGTTPRIKTDINFKTILGRSSGETFQLMFAGDGMVLVQPSEDIERKK